MATTPAVAALRAVAALARQHSNALAHYEAGADEDIRFWAEAKRLLDAGGVDLEEVRRKLHAIVDRRHTPGRRPDRCRLCRTLNAERRRLLQVH